MASTGTGVNLPAGRARAAAVKNEGSHPPVRSIQEAFPALSYAALEHPRPIGAEIKP